MLQMLFVFAVLRLNFYAQGESFVYSKHPFALLQAGTNIGLNLNNNIFIHFDGFLYRTMERDTLSYRDIFSREFYYPYSYDPQPVIGHKRIFEVMFKRGYILYKRSNFEVKSGRDTILWPSRLFLYGNGYPFDFLYHMKYNRKRISFVSFNAGLMDTCELKRLAAQLVVWSPNENFKVYLMEGVIYTRQNLLKYMNPVAPYYIIQRTSNNGPENLMGLLGVKYKNVSFFFLNDDFIIDRGGTSKYGTELQIKYRSLKFTFIRIPRYTYTHYTDTNNWAINNIPLGYPYGPDVLDFYLKMNLKKWDFNFMYLNHGEGIMSEHWLYSGMPKNPRVPSGVIERTKGLMVKYGLRKDARIGMFFYSILNFKNHIGIKENRIGLYLKLRYNLKSVYL